MIHSTVPIPDITFKDDTPLNTVARIKGILNTCGIETEERWNESGVPCCYSVRISVYGTVFGANGKGVTKEFALASGYGELMERLQLGRIFKADQQKNSGTYADDLNNTYVSAKELLTKNRKWYSLLAQKATQQTGTVVTAEDVLRQYSDDNGNTSVTRFYSVKTQTDEYLPTELLSAIYTTNGCAAGNTMEEALVQAISEIVERQFSTRILSEGISVPDIPEEVLSAYKIAYEIITFLRENNFKVIVKDCSLGTKFPVVCVCLINLQTGRYHTHFGAYPHFEIALQRTLTESFQGRDIKKVACFENFHHSKNETLDMGNLLNQLISGTSEKRPDLFLPTSKPYQKTCGFKGKNNRELLKECFEFLGEQGWDILVRDCSCLGFPTCQVIVPGYSEVFAYRLSQKHNDLRYNKFVKKLLRNPSEASIEEIMGFMMNLSQIAKQHLSPLPFSSQANLPALLSSAEEQYLMNATLANVNYSLGRKAETVKYIERMLACGIDRGTERLVCIKRYLMLCIDGYEEEKIRTILENFHQPATIQYLYSTLLDNKNLLHSFVLHCDMQCKTSCVLYDACKKRQTDALAQFIITKQREIDHLAVKTQLERVLSDGK